MYSHIFETVPFERIRNSKKMSVRAGILTFLFLIFSTTIGAKADSVGDGGFLAALEDKLELKFGEYANYITQWLVKFNDRNLGGNSEVGRLLHYEEMKNKVEEAGNKGRNMKKMGMALIPLIFHVGATSTWMLLTTILAAKSVAIGMLLLVFKIAVSSAKIASFFTILKGKHLLSHHHEWTPHYEHHGHKRSLDYLEHPPADWHSYAPPHSAPEWSEKDSSYQTLSSYKSADPYTEYAAESKPAKQVEKNYG